MAVINNKTFEQVYNKLLNTLEDKVNKYTINRRYGGKIGYLNLKKLLIMIKYLERIKGSKFDYYYVKYLTNISNYLNKI